ncbi:MAG: hypothetical protein P8Y42_12050 [Exilibacterium sp.]
MAQTVGGMDADAKPTPMYLPACLGQLPPDGRRIEGTNTPTY